MIRQLIGFAFLSIGLVLSFFAAAFAIPVVLVLFIALIAIFSVPVMFLGIGLTILKD